MGNRYTLLALLSNFDDEDVVGVFGLSGNIVVAVIYCGNIVTVAPVSNTYILPCVGSSVSFVLTIHCACGCLYRRTKRIIHGTADICRSVGYITLHCLGIF